MKRYKLKINFIELVVNINYILRLTTYVINTIYNTNQFYGIATWTEPLTVVASVVQYGINMKTPYVHLYIKTIKYNPYI